MNAYLDVSSGHCPHCSQTDPVRLLAATLSAGHAEYGSPEPAHIPRIKRSLNVLLKLRLLENDVWDAPTRSALRRFRERYPLESEAGTDEMESEAAVPAVTEYDGAFEGGGTLIPAFCGALNYMENHNKWFKRVAGTSAGAITAALIAAGYRAHTRKRGLETLEEITKSTEFDRLMLTEAEFTDDELKNSLLCQLTLSTLGILGKVAAGDLVAGAMRKLMKASVPGVDIHPSNLLNLIERGGLYDGVSFTNWLNARILAGLNSVPGTTPVSARPTFRELYQRTKIGLTVLATDVGGTSQRLLAFNARLHPNVPVADAVRMSMSIPFVFSPVSFKGCLAVDGGVIANFPAFVFSSPDDDLVSRKPSDIARPNIGFLLYERKEVAPGPPCEPPAMLGRSAKLKKVVDSLSSVYSPFSMLPQLPDSRGKNTVAIDTTGFSSLRFSVSTADKLKLIERGRAATERYFNASPSLNLPEKK
jgi:NTE family protein